MLHSGSCSCCCTPANKFDSQFSTDKSLLLHSIVSTSINLQQHIIQIYVCATHISLPSTKDLSPNNKIETERVCYPAQRVWPGAGSRFHYCLCVCVCVHKRTQKHMDGLLPNSVGILFGRVYPDD